MLPWYERGPDGVWTGREWSSEEQARAEVVPGCTVHVETSARVGRSTFARTAHTVAVPLVPCREWMPRGCVTDTY